MTKKRPRKFFIVLDDNLVGVNSKFFDQLSRADAINMGVSILSTIHEQLLDDVKYGSVTYIKTIPLLDGLERSLVELERRFPFVTREVRFHEKRLDGKRVFRC